MEPETNRLSDSSGRSDKSGLLRKEKRPREICFERSRNRVNSLVFEGSLFSCALDRSPSENHESVGSCEDWRRQAMKV